MSDSADLTECVLALDVGSTALKAALIDREGGVHAMASVALSAPENRFVAEGWMWALKSAVDKLKAEVGAGAAGDSAGPVTIRALAVSGNGPTLVSENALTLRWNEYPACRMNLDSDSPDEARAFENSIFLPRILLFRDIIGDEFEESSRIFSGPEFLIWQLTGNTVTILPEERYQTAYWNASVLEGFGIAAVKMPGFVELGHNCGLLLDNACEFLGLEKLPVFGIGPDFIAALIGSDCIQPGKIVDRAGSSEGLNMCVDKEIRAEGIRSLPSVIPGLWNISVLIPDSASLPEDLRLQKVTEALLLLKKIAGENGQSFPTRIITSGGQAKDQAWFEKKAAALAGLGLELVTGPCVDAELEGDAKVAWKGLSVR